MKGVDASQEKTPSEEKTHHARIKTIWKPEKRKFPSTVSSFWFIYGKLPDFTNEQPVSSDQKTNRDADHVSQANVLHFKMVDD